MILELTGPFYHQKLSSTKKLKKYFNLCNIYSFHQTSHYIYFLERTGKIKMLNIYGKFDNLNTQTFIFPDKYEVIKSFEYVTDQDQTIIISSIHEIDNLKVKITHILNI